MDRVRKIDAMQFVLPLLPVISFLFCGNKDSFKQSQGGTLLVEEKVAGSFLLPLDVTRKESTS